MPIKFSLKCDSMASEEKEDEIERALKKVTWQKDNCLACKWFSPADPYNADMLDKGPCLHPVLLGYELVVSGRDWCNLFDEISLEQIEELKKKAAAKQAESK